MLTSCSADQPVITIGHREPNGTQTIEIKTSRNFIAPHNSIVQTNTLTTTTTTTMRQQPARNGHNKSTNHVTVEIPTNESHKNVLDLSAFMDIDKLAIELSQSHITPAMLATAVSSSLTTNNRLEQPNGGGGVSLTNNDMCNYLVGQFETFARDFNTKRHRSEKAAAVTIIPAPPPPTPMLSFLCAESSSSPSLTTHASVFSFKSADSADNSPPTTKSSKQTTLYTKSTIRHDLDRVSSVIESIKKTATNESILSKMIDHSVQNETKFVEENAVSDKQLAKLVLNLDDEDEIDAATDKPIVKSSHQRTSAVLSETDSIDNEVDSCAIHKILLDSRCNHLTHTLKPNFLVIDDLQEDNEEEEEALIQNKILPSKDEEVEDLLDLVIIEKNESGRKQRFLSSGDGSLDEEYDLDDYNDLIKAKNEDAHDERDELVKSDLNNNNVAEVTTEDSQTTLNNNMTSSSLSNTATSISNLSAAFANEQQSGKKSCTPSPPTNNNAKLDILGLLDVTHLLEYQLNG
jgi:hypothetical protein